MQRSRSHDSRTSEQSSRNSRESSASPASAARHAEEERDVQMIADPKRRRLVQNRLAQRIYRKKQKKRLQQLEAELITHRRSLRTDNSEPMTGSINTELSALAISSPGPPLDITRLRQEGAFDANWSSFGIVYPFSCAMKSTTAREASHEALPGAEEESPEHTASILGPNVQPGRVLPDTVTRALGFMYSSAYSLPSSEVGSGPGSAINPSPEPMDTHSFHQQPQLVTVKLQTMHTVMQAHLTLLGLSPQLYVMDDNIQSPFYAIELDWSIPSGGDCGKIPSSHVALALEARLRRPGGAIDLAPTELQKVVPHHPFIDLLPFPEFRDSLLRRKLQLQGGSTPTEEQKLTTEDTWSAVHEAEICQDIELGWFLVWGEKPWDKQSWEVTEWFVRKWGEDLIGQEAKRVADFWRAQRGEPQLEYWLSELESEEEEGE